MSLKDIEILDTMARRDFKVLLTELAQSSAYSAVSTLGAAAANDAQRRIVFDIFRKHGVRICGPQDRNFNNEIDYAVNIFNRRAAELR